MKNLITKHKLNPIGTIIGGIILFATFFFLISSKEVLTEQFHIPTLIATSGIWKTSVVFFATIVALLVSFGTTGFAKLLGKPEKPIKNFFIWFILSYIIAFISGIIITKVLKFNLASNPGNKDLIKTFTILPLQLFFEEGISFFILIVCANNIFKISQNWNLSRNIGSILSAIIFGLLHFSTYYNGNVVHTLVHILLIQGLARIAFNEAGLRANSMWIPYLVHVGYDYFNFFISSKI